MPRLDAYIPEGPGGSRMNPSTSTSTSTSVTAAARRQRRVRRLTLALVAWQGLLGAWTYVAPFAFWTDFPFPGSGWLTTLGGFDGHITRDLGLAWVGLAVVTGWLAHRGPMEGLRVALATLTATGALHLAYHLTTLDLFSPGDAVAQLVALTALVVLPALLWKQATTPTRRTR